MLNLICSADFYYEGICVNSPTNFFSSSLSVGGIINSLSWNFGNGVQTDKDSVSYSYNVDRVIMRCHCMQKQL